VQAVTHCHENNVIHRDIKPENIMITHTNQVKLIDFGLSTIVRDHQHKSDVSGTPYYMAPEVLNQDYTEKADMWSIGVLLYTLVSGYLPFQGKDSHELFSRIRKADFHFKHKEFETISDLCKDFITKLLVVNPNKRLSGSQALLHPWF
jgi:calcium-dependent protein kinase